MPLVTVRSSSEAWRLLRGILAIYKPSGRSLYHLIEDLKTNLASELSQMELQERWRRFEEEKALPQNNSDSALLDPYTNANLPFRYSTYADHPLVLGDGFAPTDVKAYPVNKMTPRECGVVVVGLGSSGGSTAARMRAANLLKTVRLTLEIGRATDTGLADGKTIEVTKTKPKTAEHRLQAACAAIQASHRAVALNATGVPATSQDAYELAARGPLRPRGSNSDPFLHSMRVTRFSLKEVELEVVCCLETEAWLAQLVVELGQRMRTAACLAKTRYIRVGFLGVDHALLEKHLCLENVISSMWRTTKPLVDANRQLLRQDPLIKPIKEPEMETNF